MPLIKDFCPGSITSVWDMRRALELVLVDSFDKVGSTGCTGPDSIDFTIEEDVPFLDLQFQIKVLDITTPEYANERHLLAAWRVAGLSLEDTLLAIEGAINANGTEEDSARIIQLWRNLKACPIPSALEPRKRPAQPVVLTDDERNLLDLARELGFEETLGRIKSFGDEQDDDDDQGEPETPPTKPVVTEADRDAQALEETGETYLIMLADKIGLARAIGALGRYQREVDEGASPD